MITNTIRPLPAPCTPRSRGRLEILVRAAACPYKRSNRVHRIVQPIDMSALLYQNAIFLHIPKTGGSFVRQVLLATRSLRFDYSHEHADMERTINCRGHYPANFLRSSWRLGKNIDTHARQCFKFCFVRNPFSWYESFWRFMEDHQWRKFSAHRKKNPLGIRVDPWSPFEILENLPHSNFNTFMEAVIHTHPGFLTRLFGSYTDPLHIDYVGRQECLADDLKCIFEILQIPLDSSLLTSIDRTNASRTPLPRWDKDIQDLLYQLEYAIFYQYGYDESSTAQMNHRIQGYGPESQR